MLPKTKNTHLHNAKIKCEQRGQLRLIAVLLTLAIIGSLSVCNGQTIKTNSGGGPPGLDLKVMTWNVDGGRCGTDRSMAPFAQVIRDHSPDVIAIQEIHRDQASRLATATGLHVYFVQTLDCRDKGPDFGLAILSRYSFAENSRKIYLLPNHPSDTGRREFRKMAGVSIHVGSQLIRIYNTHLTAIGNSGSFFNFYRLLQVSRIRTFIIDDQMHSGEWPILMGDFNSQPGTLAYRLLQMMFNDANPQASTTRAGTRVDYIFVRRGTGLNIVDVGRLNTGGLSDHFPVVARLSFNLLND